MSNEIQAGAESPGLAESRWPSKESLAAILVRFVGVYFTVRGVALAAEAMVFLFFTAQKVGLEDALRGRMFFYVSIATELGAGLYLLFGGQWVFRKLLMPVAREPLDDDGQSENTTRSDIC
ncbi:MAG: hypothetical protein ABFC96_10425 [Thermoguttaceae bacterium]